MLLDELERLQIVRRSYAARFPPAAKDDPHNNIKAGDPDVEMILNNITSLQFELSELRAVRKAYASEFPRASVGDPYNDVRPGDLDVGRVHENIRKLKATVAKFDAISYMLHPDALKARVAVKGEDGWSPQLEAYQNLLKERDYWKYTAEYLADCHAASAEVEGRLSRASKSSKKRFKSICLKASALLSVEDTPPYSVHRSRNHIIDRLKRAAEALDA